MRGIEGRYELGSARISGKYVYGNLSPLLFVDELGCIDYCNALVLYSLKPTALAYFLSMWETLLS